MGFPAKPIDGSPPPLRLVPPGDGGAPAGPLTPEHLAQMREGEKRAKKIRRAAGVAAFGGWSAAIFAVLSAAFSLTDPAGLAVAAVLAVVAYHELKGRVELLRFDVRATKRLALNQAFFAAALMGYGAWKLYGALNGQVVIPQQASTGDAEMDAMVAGMARTASVAVYGGVIAVGLLVPGLTAMYYWSRRSLVENFVRSTPPWVVEAMRTRV